jgi:hypothetical protein
MVEHMAGGRMPAIPADKQEILVPAGVLLIRVDSTLVVEHLADNRASRYLPESDKAGDQTATAGAMDMQLYT